MRTGAAVAQHPDWRDALADLISQIPLLAGVEDVHLALLFASAQYSQEFPDLVASTRQLTGARLLVGCSGQGVIGAARAVEGEPAHAHARRLPDQKPLRVHFLGDGLPARDVAPIEEVASDRRP